MGQTVVVGGYGNAGRKIVQLLLEHTAEQVVVAGRDLSRAQRLVDTLGADRLHPRRVDVTRPTSLRAALDEAGALIVAAGTSADWRVSLESALDAGCHQLDIQIGSAKNTALRARDAQVRDAGVSVITDCGFHPGVPAAMVRLVAARLPNLTTAVVSSWIGINWRELSPFADSTVTEMVSEFADYRYEALVEGRWQAPRRTWAVVFPEPVGRQKVAAMGLDEMRAVAAEVSTLTDTGFYVGGFSTPVTYGVIPVVYAGMKLAPQLSARPMGHLLDWGLRRFSRPPYGTVLQLDAAAGGTPARPVLRLSHTDAYLLTAAPVVATVRQLLAGPTRPGVHLQGVYVDPPAFFADLAAMGVQLWAAPMS